MGLKFKAVGSVRTVPLYPDAEDSARQDVKLRIRLMGPGRVRSWKLKLQASELLDAKRMAKLRDGTTKETAPLLWDDRVSAPETMAEMEDFYRTVLKEALIGVEGVQVGDTDLATIEDVDKLLTELEAIGLAELVATRVVKEQTPNDVQVFA